MTKVIADAIVTYVSATNTRGTRLRVRLPKTGQVRTMPFSYAARDAFQHAAAEALGVPYDTLNTLMADQVANYRRSPNSRAFEVVMCDARNGSYKCALPAGHDGTHHTAAIGVYEFADRYSLVRRVPVQ